MCEIPKTPKIYDYNGEKMGITQKEVVWIKNRGGQISLCIVNFAIIAKFRYHRENVRHRENSNFCYAQYFSL